MKTPLVVVIAVVIVIIGFLTFYSQQPGTPADKGIQEQAVAGDAVQAQPAGGEGTAQATTAAAVQPAAPGK